MILKDSKNVLIPDGNNISSFPLTKRVAILSADLCTVTLFVRLKTPLFYNLSLLINTGK